MTLIMPYDIGTHIISIIPLPIFSLTPNRISIIMYRRIMYCNIFLNILFKNLKSVIIIINSTINKYDEI